MKFKSIHCLMIFAMLSTDNFGDFVVDAFNPFGPVRRAIVRKKKTAPSHMPPLVTNADGTTPADVNGKTNGEANGKTKMTDDKSLFSVPPKNVENIFKQNREWVANQNPQFFEDLGSGHRPTYLWIGCSDARASPNEIMGEPPGSVFVVRNVANMVVNTDFNLMSALQYAMEYLKIPHVIVCGHYDCGGIRASVMNRDHVPPLENWLRNIRDVYRLHQKELDAIKDPEARHRRLVEINVVEQCINLFKTGAVQRRRVETYKNLHPLEPSKNFDGIDYSTPRIHACVFDPKDGILRQLPVDFKEVIDDLHEIYDLYSIDD